MGARLAMSEAIMTSSDGPKGGSGTQGGRVGVRGARCVALIGPFASGKTSLLEAILDTHRRYFESRLDRSEINRRRQLAGSPQPRDER